MELFNLTEDIIKDCYSSKSDKVYSNIQSFIDRILKEKELCEKMLPVFNIIMPAIENKDIVLLGDCFEYGIKSILQGKEIQLGLFNDTLLHLPEIKENIYYLGTYSDEPALCVKDDIGKTHRINSLFSPDKEVEIWFNALNMKKTTPAVCLFGLGTGLFAEKILESLKDDGVLVIFEPDRLIYEYCMESGYKQGSDPIEIRIAERLQKVLKDKRVYNIVGDVDGSALQELLSFKLDYTCMKGLVVAKHNNYDLVFPHYYDMFYSAINGFINYIQTRINVERLFKDYYCKNFSENIKYIKEGILYSEISRYLPKDVPVIIVSAGPSLDINIEILKQAKGHMLIVAVDTALKILVNKGIVPDITITLDPNKAENCFSDDVSLEVPCMISLDANPKIIARLKGPKFIFNISDDYADKLYKSIGKGFEMVYSNGGSVATAVFAIFTSFGQKKMIFVGQDLAFKDGKSHAGGIDMQLGYEESLVDGINGEKVKTRLDWLIYLRWFEKSISLLKEQKKNIRVIDATEGGALIRGTEIMTLQEAIDECRDSTGKLPIFDFSQEIKKMNQFLSETEYNLLYEKHLKAFSELKDIDCKSKEAIELCNNLIAAIEKGQCSETEVEDKKRHINYLKDYVCGTAIFPLIDKYIESDIASRVSDLLLIDGDHRIIEINKIKALQITFEAISDASNNISMNDAGIAADIL